MLSRYLLLFITVAVISCTGDKYDGPMTIESCFDKETEILNSTKSEDAPKLNISTGIESGEQCLVWDSIDSAIYYELDECFCPDFSDQSYKYILQELRISKSNLAEGIYYYRIRAVVGNSTTGWSNVKKL